MNRRRFLTLSAAFACAPALAGADTWSGQALGADISVTLHGPREMTRRALADVPKVLEKVEQTFSLFRDRSDLSQLNRTGELTTPSPLMQSLMAQVDTAHLLSNGLFDPTIQPLWQALALGYDPEPARAALGWDRLRWSNQRIELQRGQALTFNGIAQGFATDLMRDMLVAHGATRALVNIGEQVAIGGPFTIGLEDPTHGHLGTRQLRDMTIASSSPAAMMFGDDAHILGPRGETPIWSTVSIEGQSATMADALSTAAVFMDLDALTRLKNAAQLHRVTVIDNYGNLRTV
ncbi:MAG: FAD:protein FMN transferase [Pelagibaca sp.]